MKTKRKPCPGVVASRDLRKHTKELTEYRVRIERLESGLDFILNKVSANGREGLENSLKDIYAEIKNVERSLNDVLVATKTSRAWTDLRKLLRVIARESPFLAFFSSKIAKIVLSIVILLVVNSLLHAIGIGLDFQSILRLLRFIP